MVNLIITGANGFVGKNLGNYLKESSFNSRLFSLRNVSSINIDSDAIIHLAGKAHDLKNASSPDEYYKVNFELTKNIYDAFLHSKARKFIFVSSVKAVADNLDSPLSELHHPNPVTHYGKSKLLAEQYILDQPLPEGKSFYILRPCMIHGPGNKGNLNLLYKFVSKGLPYPLASFENRRSFLSVENLCFIIKEILEREDIPSGVYNVADDEALSTNQVVEILSRSLGRSPRFLPLSTRFVKGLARIGDWAHLPLNSERLQKLTENYIVDNTKIKEALKKPLPLSAPEGIMITARSFKHD